MMLTYNRPQYIGRAIESIIAQNFEAWELLVVHDGPNERIAAVMEEWQKRDAADPVPSPGQGRQYRQCHQLRLSDARGEYIAILDDDDYWPAPEQTLTATEPFSTRTRTTPAAERGHRYRRRRKGDRAIFKALTMRTSGRWL